MEGERRWLERKVERKRDRGWKERHCWCFEQRERERERERERINVNIVLEKRSARSGYTI